MANYFNLAFGIRRLVRSIARGISSPYGQKVMLFAIFLFIATTLWYLHALSRRYSAEISLAVEYTDLPPNKILVGDLPEKLRVGVTATGYNILRYRLGSMVRRVKISINSFALRNSSIGEVFYLPTSKIKDNIDFQLPNIPQVNYILPDSLYFRFTEARRKKLPVVADYAATFARQYMQKGKVQIIPDSIWVSGPALTIDTMKAVYTRPVEFTDAKDKQTAWTSTNKLPYTNFETSRYEVTLYGEKYTEGSVKINVNARGVPDSLRLRTFPAQVTVTYIVCLSDYDKADAHQFEALVRYVSDTTRLKVVVSRFPSFVRISKVEPPVVDYLIEVNK